MLQFQRSLLKGFDSRLPSKVISMVKGKRTKKKVKTVKMYNIELIFSRVMYLLSANQIDSEDAFNYEFSLFPASIFEDIVEPRFTISKSVSKNKLKVEVSSLNVKPDTVVIDDGRMLYSAVHCPKE